MNPITKAILYIAGAIIALAALITAGLYDWSNKEPGETGSDQSSNSDDMHIA